MTLLYDNCVMAIVAVIVSNLLPRNLRFLMENVLSAMLAEFFEFYLPLDAFLVFARVIIPVGANRALEPY